VFGLKNDERKSLEIAMTQQKTEPTISTNFPITMLLTLIPRNIQHRCELKNGFEIKRKEKPK
jgi:hypothetical protein